MKILPHLGIVLVTEDAPIWGLSLFMPFGTNVQSFNNIRSASAQLQPFDQEVLGFLGLFAALGAAALTWLPWDAPVCGSCCFSTAPNSVWSNREMANENCWEIHPTMIFWMCFNLFKPLHYFKCNEI